MQYYKDILFPDAVEIVLTSGIVSAGRIHNNLHIGPTRSVRLVEEMESLGIIGPSLGNRPRSVLITLDEWYETKHTFVHLEDPVRCTPPTHSSGAAMYCRHCGKQISASSKFCDGCGKSTSGEQAPTNKKKKHPILSIIISLLVFFFVIGSCGKSDTEKPQKIDANTSSPTATKPASQIYGIGDRLEKGGVAVTLNDVYEVGPDIILEPAEGNVFVIFDLTIENNTDDDLTVSSIMCFKAYFDDFSAEYSLGAMSADSSNRQLDATLTPGKKIKGVVGFEAPENWKDAEITFEPEFFNSNVFTFNYSR